MNQIKMTMGDSRSEVECGMLPYKRYAQCIDWNTSEGS